MESIIKYKLGRIIRANRKAKNLSQQNLSDIINYNQSVISKVESGNMMIPDIIYLKLLKYFNLNYIVDPEIDQKMQKFISEVYQTFLYLKYEHLGILKSKMDELKEKNHNVIHHYELRILELVVYFLNQQYERCKMILKEMLPYYEVCDEICQIIYLYYNQYFVTLYKIGKPINIFQLGFEYTLSDSDGLIEYILGWYHYQHYNYSKAIQFLYDAIKKFEASHNLCRFIRSHLLINEILLLDKHYLEVYEICINLLNEYTTKKCKDDYILLYLQLSYCAYYLKKYKEAKEAIEVIINEKDYKEYHFIKYLYIKCTYQLEEDFNTDLMYQLEDNKENCLLNLYFSKHPDEKFYALIEKNIIPDIKTQCYKTEYQYYTFLLLHYYWDIKKYRKYKKLNETIHKILHIS